MVCYQEPTTVKYPEPQRCSSQAHIFIYKINCNIILQCVQFLTSRLSHYPYHALLYCRHLLIKPDFQCLLSKPVTNTCPTFPSLTC